MLKTLVGWKGYVATAAIAAFIGASAAGGVQQLRINAFKAELKAASDRNAMLLADNQVCAHNVQVANASINALKQLADSREQKVRQELEKAQAAASVHEMRADELTKKIRTVEDECTAIKHFVDEYWGLR